jgi:hypothetical protein
MGLFLTLGVLPHSRCTAMGSGARGIILARRSSTPARPYICRFKVLSRFTWPSTTPLLHCSVTAASTARISCRNRPAKFWIKTIPLVSACSIQRCKRETVRKVSEDPCFGFLISDRKPNIRSASKHSPGTQTSKRRRFPLGGMSAAAATWSVRQPRFVGRFVGALSGPVGRRRTENGGTRLRWW